MLRKAMSLTLGSLLAAGLTVAVSPAGFADPALAALSAASTAAHQGAPASLRAATHQGPAADDAHAAERAAVGVNFDAFTEPLNEPNYVAIGDSYAVASFALTTIWEPCFRNWVDYPHLTSAQTGLPLVEPACIGGSGTGYWYSSKIKGTNVAVKLPYRALLNKHTKLATINLGLNDIMLAYNKKVLRECLAAAYLNRDREHSACGDQVEKQFRPLIKVLPKVLEGIYTDAKQRIAKDGMVIAVGYVEMFHGQTPCWDNGLIGPADRAYINSVFKRVNRAVRIAARKAHVPYYIPGDEQSLLTSTCGLPFLRRSSFSGLPELAYPIHPTFANAVMTSRALSSMYLEEHPYNVRTTTVEAVPDEDDDPTERSTELPTAAPSTSSTSKSSTSKSSSSKSSSSKSSTSKSSTPNSSATKSPSTKSSTPKSSSKSSTKSPTKSSGSKSSAKSSTSKNSSATTKTTKATKATATAASQPAKQPAA